MDRPMCKTCPYYDATASTVIYPRPTPGQQAAIIPMAATIEAKGICRRNPLGGGHKRPEEWCGEHPRYPEFITAWTHGEMTNGGPATNTEEWRHHHGSTATVSMKDLVAKGITIEPATQAMESSKPASGEHVEPRPRWVDGNPTEPGIWVVQWQSRPYKAQDIVRTTNHVVKIDNPDDFTGIFSDASGSFGPIPPPPSTAAGAGKLPGAPKE